MVYRYPEQPQPPGSGAGNLLFHERPDQPPHGDLIADIDASEAEIETGDLVPGSDEQLARRFA
jgi:hypothetical protein